MRTLWQNSSFQRSTSESVSQLSATTSDVIQLRARHQTELLTEELLKMSDSEPTNEAPVKRGRGRPRKDPSAAPAKKNDAVSNGATKGKRGRKPGSGKKATSNAAQGVKRGRGRPKKTEGEKIPKAKKAKKADSSESEVQDNSSPEEESDE